MGQANIVVFGDVHGHIQLALSVCVLFQREHSLTLDAIFFCGDVGTFTSSDDLDSTTRAHARRDPSELEFLHQWAQPPAPPWLSSYFEPISAGGLGIDCPLIMVHGNHEGFTRLASVLPEATPGAPVAVEDLPWIDNMRRIRYLPSGWRVTLPTGHTVAGLGGIEEGQRNADYHPMAYVDDEALLRLCECEPQSVDILLTHQGPSRVQGRQGAADLDMILESRAAKTWFHGHSVLNSDVGIVEATTVVPLGDLHKWERGKLEGCALVQLRPEHTSIERALPKRIRDLKATRWWCSQEGDLVSPLIAQWGFRNWRRAP